MNPLSVIHSEEDYNPRDSHCKTTQDECKSMTDVVGEGGNEHGESERHDPGWDGAELSFDRAVAVAIDDCGGEIGVALLEYVRIR